MSPAVTSWGISISLRKSWPGIAAAAALETDGVSSLAANLGSDIAELLGKKNLAKGVRIKTEEDKVEVELSVLIVYGHTIPQVGKAHPGRRKGRHRVHDRAGGLLRQRERERHRVPAQGRVTV